MPETKLMPWELANKEGKTFVLKMLGTMVAVYYPYRKSGDLYVVGPDGPGQVFHCCQQCDADFPIDKFIEHVNSHNKHLKRFPVIVIDSALIHPSIRDQVEKFKVKP